MATVATVYTIEPFERTPEQVEANRGAASAMGRTITTSPRTSLGREP